MLSMEIPFYDLRRRIRAHGVSAGKSAGRSIDDLDLPQWFIDDAKALQVHPSFHAALRLQAEGVVEVFENTFALTKLISEEARYLISIAWLAMHHSRDPGDPSSGATVTRLQAFAQHFELAGPNRVAALVALMKHFGFLDEVRASSDRRMKRLEPTARGLAVAEAMTIAALKPIQLLSQAHRYLDRMAEDRDFAGRFFAENLRLYAGGARIVSALPEYHLFATQNAGREMMFKLWIALTDNGPAEPAIVSCSYGEMARSLNVSRGHIRRMIEKGEEQGLFVVHAPGGQAIEILPGFIHLHQTVTSLEYAQMLRAADIAASTQGPAASVWW